MTSIPFDQTKLYEPSPRFLHGAAAVNGKCYLWGGCVQDFSESGRRKLASSIEVFDPYLETWEKHHTTGVPPPGLYDGACTSLLDSLYWFGGYDSRFFHNSLHKLDPTTLEWSELQPLNQADGPMRKAGCGMVSFLQDRLAMFGGYGILTDSIQPGAMFTKSTTFTGGKGWSNELNVFNIMESKWSSPPTTGPRPPPCGNFSFTAINNHQAVLFGGYQPGTGRVNDCYLMDFGSMEWTKLEKSEGASWPVERSAHAACCLNYGEEHPQLLVTGGLGKNNDTLQDAWILDVKSREWRELPFPKGAQPRVWHTATAMSLEPEWTQVTMFGGCLKWERGKSADALPKLAKSTVLEFESEEFLPSTGGFPTKEWVLVSVEELEQRKTELGDSDKMELKDQNVQTNTLEMKDHNTQTEIVQIKDQQVQAESATQQQGYASTGCFAAAGFCEVELNDQQIQTETVESMEPHVKIENVTPQQDEVELKDQQAKSETADQQVQTGETVHQQEYLRGFETFAEANFNITDSHAHSFEWQKYGLKLHIPEGALPAAHTVCKIDIKVGLAGQFRIPDDLQLVSCIYWLRGSQRPFLKPVTLEVEHCASIQDSSQCESLHFVVAKCSQAELPYEFRELKKGTFVQQSSYGSIQVSQFSFFGITISRRFSRLSQYYSALFYIEEGPNWWHVDFVITLHLKGSWKAIEDNYSRLNAISGPRFMVQFENDTISLEISEDGICLENGWTITPLIPPVIDKQQVHRFKPQQEVPYCRLQVKLDKDKKPVDLKHKVKLHGAKSPRDFFFITCPPEGALKKRPFSDAADTPILSPVAAENAPSSGSTASLPRDLGSKYKGLESEPELSDLMNEVASKVSAKWKQISIQLGLTPNDEECFLASNPNDPIQCITSVFKVWKKRAQKPYTWSTVIKVLNAPAVDEIRLAKELTTKLSAAHCSSPQTVSN